ncbi:MAG: alginate export family protein [Gammaproteobacteria bacterium]|nr:alginate export family protein [Gammaproteobacteria bacterium]
MPHLTIIIFICLIVFARPTAAADLAVDFTFDLEHSALDGMSLGDDPGIDRQIESATELEVTLEYPFTNQLFAFLTVSLIDENESIETTGPDQQASGIERNEMGVAYLFGDDIDATVKLGRAEFNSESEWWVWWDESLDAISVEASYAGFETLLAIAEEQARASTADDFIDPEINDLRRILFSLAWEFSPRHSLMLYYLDQTDNSASYMLGEMVDERKIDEADADVAWTGLSYLGEFTIDKVGAWQIELHGARVSGRETLYEFDDPVLGQAEVTERENYRISGSARAGLLQWQPSFTPGFGLLLGSARDSGDRDLDDLRDRSFRFNGLQGDGEAYGELFRPELSNLEVDLLGLDWQINPDSKLTLVNYRYRQRHAADEMRDTALEIDPSGNSKQLGQETDLVLTLQGSHGMEWIITLAEFKAGNAYGGNPRETVNYFKIEFDVEF